MGKLARTLLALGVPLVLLAGGCSSSSSTALPQPSNDAGAIDSGGDSGGGSGDAGTDTGMSPTDSGGMPTCASICMKASGLPCYDQARCNTNCNTAEQMCGGAAAFQPFLTCASNVTPMCDAMNHVTYPNCSLCAMDAGGSDAMCQAMATTLACTNCCGGLYPAGAASLQMILIGCECGASGACQAQCATELCAATPTTPQTGGACDVCVQGSLGADGGSGACAMPVATGCASDASCSMFLNCSSGCP